MPTFIDGIAASENIDSSGERLSIAGMDISSLDKTGTFNWEHKKDLPNQTVGKILKAKKIFDESECEDDRQAFYWSKCQVPFVYVMGELFDEYCDSSKHLAGLFRYDHDKQGQNEHDVIGFSIEGAKLAKDGMNITRSIARKCTITESPCNKTAIAQMVPVSAKDDGDAIFKTEPTIEIMMFKSEPVRFAKDGRDLQKHSEMLGLTPMEKALTSKPGATMPPAPGAAIPAKTNNPGSLLGQTKTGQNIFSHAQVHEYNGLSSADHNDAATLHHNAAMAATSPQAGAHHMKQVRFHMQAAGTAERREQMFPKARAASAAKPRVPQFPVLRRSMDAGSAMESAPGTLTQGAALQGEIVLKPKKKKLEALMRAEEEYAKWAHKDEFRSFMQKRMPSLTKGEIDAIGQTIALKKSIEDEKALANLVKKKK